jgi:outer membrane biosynthesis protein TonB
MRSIAVALLLALAPGAFPSPALAQSTTDDPTTAMARARFKEGVDFFDKGSFEQARASFLQAYALKKHPAVLLNLAWSCLKSGHALEAEHYFRQYLTESKDSTDKQRADANDGLNQSHAKLGRIEVVATAGTDVSIDGEHEGSTPLGDAVYVEPGAHTVKFKGTDGATDTNSVTVLAGEKAIARFAKLVTAPPPPPAASAAEPPPPPPPPPKEEEEEPKPEEHAEAKPAPHTDEPEPSHGSSSLSVVPAIIGGIVVVAGGVVAGVMLNSKETAQSKANATEANITSNGGKSCVPPTPSTLQGLAQACNSFISDNHDINTDATIGNIAIAVSGVALGVTIVYYVIAAATHHDSTASAQSGGAAQGFFKGAVLSPEVGRQTGGLSFTASF